MVEEKIETVEVPEAGAEEEVKEEKKPTVEEVAESGLQTEEIKFAEKHKLIDKKEDGKEDKGKQPEKKEDKGKQEEPSILQKMKDGKEVTPEEESAELGNLDKKGQAYYFQMKNERRKRQDAANERDLLKVKLKAYEKENEDLKSKKPSKKSDGIDDELSDILGEDDEGKGKKKDKFLTQEDLDKREKEKEEKVKKGKEMAQTISTRMDALEAEEKTANPDYKVICDIADDVLKNHDKRHLLGDELIMLSNMLVDNENPSEEDNPIKFIYTIAKRHPKFDELLKAGDKGDKGSKKEEKKKGTDIDKILENSQKRSSASVAGGKGRKKIAISDLTLADCKGQSQDWWNALPRETRVRLLKEAG